MEKKTLEIADAFSIYKGRIIRSELYNYTELK